MTGPDLPQTLAGVAESEKHTQARRWGSLPDFRTASHERRCRRRAPTVKLPAMDFLWQAAAAAAGADLQKDESMPLVDLVLLRGVHGPLVTLQTKPVGSERDAS